jgi:hypothetical protein
MLDFYNGITVWVKENFNDVKISSNFEDVLSYAKSNELSSIVIVSSAFNYSGSKYNVIRGQQAAEIIHLINPNIPILIWDGRTYKYKNYPIECNLFGQVLPIKNINEYYLEIIHYSDKEIFKIIKNFYSKKLDTTSIKIDDFFIE